jgi:hypothetical protein
MKKLAGLSTKALLREREKKISHEVHWIGE